MNKKQLALLAGGILILTMAILQAATFVKQKYHFLGLTLSGDLRSPRDRKIFWIAEDLSGEASVSHIIQVILDKNQAFTLHTQLEELGDWDILKRGIARLEQEKSEELSRERQAWVSKRGEIKVKAPEPDEKRIEKFHEHQVKGGSNGTTWNEKHGVQGIDLPRIEGMKAKLVYFYPEGLYISYQIRKVYYFPEYRYLLVFTNQKAMAIGRDTMHGFLILGEDKPEKHKRANQRIEPTS